MKRFLRKWDLAALVLFLMSLYGFLVWATYSQGACQGGSCSAVAGNAMMMQQPMQIVQEVRQLVKAKIEAEDPDRFFVWRGNEVVALIDVKRSLVYTWNGSQWSDPVSFAKFAERQMTKAEPKPAVKEEKQPEKLLTGVVEQKLAGTADVPYRINGQPATREECMALIEAPELPNDANKPFLVAVGSKDFQKQVTEDLLKEPSLASKVRFQAYGPESFQAKRLNLADSAKFRETGKYVCLMSPDGTAQAATFTYQAGDVKKFDPEKVKSPSGDDPLAQVKIYWDSAVAFATKNPLIVLFGVGVVFLLLTGKK